MNVQTPKRVISCTRRHFQGGPSVISEINRDVDVAPQVTPMILTTQAEIDQWMTAPTPEALELQRLLPDGNLIVVRHGSRKDEEGQHRSTHFVMTDRAIPSAALDVQQTNSLKPVILV